MTTAQKTAYRWTRAIIASEPAHLVAVEPEPRGTFTSGVCGRDFLASCYADSYEPRCEDCAATRAATDARTDTEPATEADGGRPRHVGVEGLSMAAARLREPHTSAGRALDALRHWLPGIDRGAGAAGAAELVTAIRPDRFPFAEVLAHYRGVGHSQVAGELVLLLERLNGLLVEHAVLADRRLWPLPQWLPDTVDQRPDLGASLLESVIDVEDADQATDVLLAALAADLALIEANALQWGRPSREQWQRTQACLLLLSNLAELAPTWTQRPTLTVPPRLTTGDHHDHTWLADVTGKLAAHVHANVPEPCRLAVELSMLPTTRLHDEQLFIRSIQIFETLWRQVHRCLVRANAALREMDAERACAEFADATRRLSLSSVLHRLSTTMPPQALALIREHGRGPTRLRRYKQAEDAFLTIVYQAGLADTDLLAGQLRALDSSWRAMKHAHRPLFRP